MHTRNIYSGYAFHECILLIIEIFDKGLVWNKGLLQQKTIMLALMGG